MNKTNELLQKLNTMQNEHIKVLEERIEVLNKHLQHLNETITSQARRIEELIDIALINKGYKIKSNE
jgi:prefoldin subunit 5